MTSRIAWLALWSVLLGPILLSAAALGKKAERVQIHTDFTEADAALAILEKRQTAQPVTDADWEALFSTEPFARLKKREAAMHRPLTNDDFKKFMLSEDLLNVRDALTRTASHEVRENWERGKRDFSADLEKVSDFFLQVLNGTLQGDAIGQKGAEFFGLQGPWYTVGYRMAVMIEERYGRAKLIDCMRDPRLLLARYNAIAEEMNARLPRRQSGTEASTGLLALWPREILEGTQAQTNVRPFQAPISH